VRRLCHETTRMLCLRRRCTMPLACKKCPYVVAVPPGEKPPPWCPRCGADLKPAETTSPASPSAPQTASAWDAARPSGAVGEAKTPLFPDDKSLLALPAETTSEAPNTS